MPTAQQIALRQKLLNKAIKPTTDPTQVAKNQYRANTLNKVNTTPATSVKAGTAPVVSAPGTAPSTQGKPLPPASGIIPDGANVYKVDPTVITGQSDGEKARTKELQDIRKMQATGAIDQARADQMMTALNTKYGMSTAASTPAATVPTATNPIVNIGGGSTQAGQTTDQNRLTEIALKQYKGEPLSDDDVKYLINQQLTAKDSAVNAATTAAQAEQAAATTRIDAATAQKDATAARNAKTSKGLVDQQKELLETQARAQIDQIKANANSEQTAGQNILAFNGFGVSSGAVTQAQNIQAKYNAQITAVNQAKDLAVQKYQAELAGADQAVLNEMQANIDTMQSNADDMAYENAVEVAQLNADNNLDPLTALSNIMQVLPPQVAATVNTDVSKLLGYAADESGNPVLTDAEGNPVPILTDTPEAKNTRLLDDLVKSGASPEIIAALKEQLGVTDYTDPITQADLALKQAEAKIKQQEANGEVVSPLDQIDLAQKTYDYYESMGYNPSVVPTGGEYGAVSFTTPDGYQGVRFNVQDGVNYDNPETKRDESQCGAFVNDVTGIGMDDLYTQKMSLVDKSLTVPAAGMVYVQAITGGQYAKYGHTGMVEYYNPETGMVGTVSANAKGDGKIVREEIPLSTILNGGGFAKPPKSMSADAAITLDAVDKDLRTAVTTKANQFDGEPLVRNFQTIQEGYSYLKNLDPENLTSSDNQSIIYAFAKIMDPNSVVRESEYDTVQKYAQSLAATYGFDAQRLLTNTEFLTPEAVKNMINTVEGRYDASKGSYQKFRDEYVRTINNLAGGVDIGDSVLQDYSFTPDGASSEDYGTLYDGFSDESVANDSLWENL